MDFANNRCWGGNWEMKDIPSAASTLGIQGYGNNNEMCSIAASGRVIIHLRYQLRIAPGLGLWVEGRTTNYLLRSRDGSNASWTKTNCTAARTSTGADIGSTANTATRVTATAANATIQQAVTLASTQVIASVFIRRVTGTGTVRITQDGGTTWTNVTSLINSTDYTRVNTAAQTLANPDFRIEIQTSGDAIDVDFAQLENSAFVTCPLLTTTATVQRAAELPTFNTTGTAYNEGQRIISNAFFGTPASFYAEFCGNGVSGHRVIGGALTWQMEGGADGAPCTFGLSGATAATVNNGNTGLYNWNKAAGRMNGGGSAVCMNGGAIATNASATVQFNTYSHIGLGNNGGSTVPLNGIIRRMTIWRRELTNGELLELTR
ncbi:MAG: hypothetical protein EBV03_10645 [Proteobacteria bacterium]|nr:hypothetical protein [Pseudomonadota bacterium]